MLSPGRKVGTASGIEKTNTNCTNCTNAGWAKTNTESTELTETQRKNSCYSWFFFRSPRLTQNVTRNTLHVYNTQHIYEPRISDLRKYIYKV